MREAAGCGQWIDVGIRASEIEIEAGKMIEKKKKKWKINKYMYYV